MARTGWGAMGYEITTGSNDATKVISKDRWNLPLDKGAGILGFDAQTTAGASSVTPGKSILILSGSTETATFALDDSEQFDVLWVFTSGTVALTNKTSTVDANGQIVGLGSASTITLSQTIPKIFIRRTVGSYDAWFEYGGGAIVSANDLTGTTLASGVVTSSLTAVGTIVTGTWTGTAVGDTYISSASTWNGKQDALTFGISDGNVAKCNDAVVDNDFLKIDGTEIEGRSASEVLSDIGAQASLTFGIADTNAVKIDGSGTATGEYAKFTATGVIGEEVADVKTDLSLNNVENTAISTWTGSTNVATLGTITTGTWTGTDIAIADGGTGAGTAQTAIDALTAVSAATNEYVLTKDTSTGNALWKVGGGGAHTEQEWTVYDPASFTPTPAVANTEAYMYTEEIDSDNDGLFIQMWKNGASQAVQIA